MRRILLIASLSALAVINHAQQAKPAADTDEAALVAINRQFIQDFLRNDTFEHTRIIHSDFLFIGKDGSLHDRSEYMKGWAHGYDSTVMPEFSLEEFQVRIFGEMALIVAKTRDKTIKDGKWVTGETRYTDTYVKEKGQWKCVQVQLTKVPMMEN